MQLGRVSNPPLPIAAGISAWMLRNYGIAGMGAGFKPAPTYNRQHYPCSIFKKPPNGHFGIIVNVLWHEIKNHANNIDLGDFTVIMAMVVAMVVARAVAMVAMAVAMAAMAVAMAAM